MGGVGIGGTPTPVVPVPDVAPVEPVPVDGPDGTTEPGGGGTVATAGSGARSSQLLS